MKPDDAQTYFSDYLEGGLDAAARRRFEQLLAQDPQLRSEYDLFARTRELVAGLEPEPASPDFEDRVLARLANGLEPARPPLPWFSRGLIGAAAAAAALLAFSLSVIFQGGTLPVPDAPQDLVAAVPGASAEPLPVADPDEVALARQVEDISELIREINTLNERYRRHEEEILLSAGQEQELIFRPSSYYRLASQRGGAERSDDRAVVYAR